MKLRVLFLLYTFGEDTITVGNILLMYSETLRIPCTISTKAMKFIPRVELIPKLIVTGIESTTTSHNTYCLNR